MVNVDEYDRLVILSFARKSLIEQIVKDKEKLSKCNDDNLRLSIVRLESLLEKLDDWEGELR